MSETPWETLEGQPLASGCYYCGAGLTYHDRVGDPVHLLWVPADRRVAASWAHERCLPKASFSAYRAIE